MKIGIIGAMEVEVKRLKSKLKNATTKTVAGMEFCEGEFGNTHAVVVQSGIGKINAAICVQILVDVFHITHVLNTGIAGSLNNDINIGDVVISTDAVYHDFDLTVFGYQYGEVPQIGAPSFKADEKMRKAAVKAVKEADPEIGVFEGRVASGDQFVGTKAQKKAVLAHFPDAYCAEMEGCAIAQAAHVNNIPFVIVRAISDKADESSTVAYPDFEASAADHCARLVEYMMKHYEEFV